MKASFFRLLAVGLSIPASLPAALDDWQLSVAAAGPAASYLKDFDGPAISGFAPLVLDVGGLTGPRSFEFIVNAGNAGISGALMGLPGTQILKFEQAPDTSHLGITDAGGTDHTLAALTPLYQDAHIVFTSDGTDTRVYVNGALTDTLPASSLEMSSLQSLAGVSDGVGGPVSARLDGHILGFASYDRELTSGEVAGLHTALALHTAPVSLSGWRNAVTTAGVLPATTVFRPVSGMAPVLTDLGELSGPSSFEFILNAGTFGQSQAMMGRTGLEGLKFEQWEETGLLGLTQFGIADYNSGFASPYNALTQAVWVNDGTSTTLYINGQEQHFFDGIPLRLTSIVGLGGSATVTGLDGITSYRDPLDGQVLRFASYDEALSAEEIGVHYLTFQVDAGEGAFTAWQSEVNGGEPATVIAEPVSGSDQRIIDVGQLSGSRTFEFIVNAGKGTASGALLGGNSQAIKFEQWDNTGNLGITAYGVADFDSFAQAPEFTDTHIVYVSDGTDTSLYVNGSLVYTFMGTALTGTGQQGLATAAVLPIISATWSDRIDGHILGFASYPEVLSLEEIIAHYSALVSSDPVPPVPFTITGISRNETSGEITLTWSSEDGAIYRVEYGDTPSAFPSTIAASVPATFGGVTSFTFPSPGATPSGRLFFRIVLP